MLTKVDGSRICPLAQVKHTLGVRDVGRRPRGIVGKYYGLARPGTEYPCALSKAAIDGVTARQPQCKACS